MDHKGHVTDQGGHIRDYGAHVTDSGYCITDHRGHIIDHRGQITDHLSLWIDRKHVKIYVLRGLIMEAYSSLTLVLPFY